MRTDIAGANLDTGNPDIDRSWNVLTAPELLQSCLAAFEWIEDSDVKSLEISLISGSNNQMMHLRSGGDHGIFEQFIRLSIDYASPLSKTQRIHRQYLI